VLLRGSKRFRLFSPDDTVRSPTHSCLPTESLTADGCYVLCTPDSYCEGPFDAINFPRGKGAVPADIVILESAFGLL